MHVIKVILGILGSNLWHLARYTGLPQWVSLKATVWLLLHEPKNWSGLLGRLRSRQSRVTDFLRRF